MNKRILFKVSNQLYLKLNKGCEQASAIWRACKHPKKTNKRASREDNMNKKQALEILNEVINNYIDIFRSDKKEFCLRFQIGCTLN